jgi:hypothetical protein
MKPLRTERVKRLRKLFTLTARNPAVRHLFVKFLRSCFAEGDKFFVLYDCVPTKTLSEAKEMVAGFEPL